MLVNWYILQYWFCCVLQNLELGLNVENINAKVAEMYKLSTNPCFIFYNLNIAFLCKFFPYFYTSKPCTIPVIPAVTSIALYLLVTFTGQPLSAWVIVDAYVTEMALGWLILYTGTAYRKFLFVWQCPYICQFLKRRLTSNLPSHGFAFCMPLSAVFDRFTLHLALTVQVGPASIDEQVRNMFACMCRHRYHTCSIITNLKIKFLLVF